MRDEGLFSSAMARPQNRAAYGDRPDAADLAAAYAFGLARNHPFLDGNKRTAFVVMELFLNLNGWTLDADDAVCISMMLKLAAGKLSEEMLAKWLRGPIERN
jgi:death-on-curing protein